MGEYVPFCTHVSGSTLMRPGRGEKDDFQRFVEKAKS